MIQIAVNGMTEEVPEDATLAFLIEHFHEADPALIVEHNNRYVHARQYESTRISPGDKIEFIHPDFGG